jgi:signal transduction histidine kinase
MNLGKVVHDVIDEITAAHPEREIQIETQEEQLGEWDAARIGQALTNLIGNAVEHGSPGSTVTVGLRGDEKDVAIRIHNRGAVIPADRLNGIFNPMKVRATPRKPLASGPTGNLGLGLYIAERIVHAHRGRIEVESLEARGTTFTVHLPRRE